MFLSRFNQKRGDIETQKAPKEKLQSSLGGETNWNHPANAYADDMASVFDCTPEDPPLFSWKELHDDLHIHDDRHDQQVPTGSSTKKSNVPFIDFLASLENCSPPPRPTPVVSRFQKEVLNEMTKSNCFIDRVSISKGSGKATTENDSDGRCPGDTNYFIADENTSPLVASSKATKVFDNKTDTRHKTWTKTEDNKLRLAVAAQVDGIDWEQISFGHFESTRNASQCKNRWRNVSVFEHVVIDSEQYYSNTFLCLSYRLSQYLRPGIIRGSWWPSEDKVILEKVKQGYRWRDIAEVLSGRTSESIRDRYANHLDPNLIKSKWTKEEDRILFTEQFRIGNKWTEISKKLPGRSVNSVKNRYHNTKKSQMLKWKRLQATRASNPIKRVRLGDLESTHNPSPAGQQAESSITEI